MQKEKIKIFGVKFDEIDFKEALNESLAYAQDSHQHFIATPNPEILLEARKNAKFKDILNSSSMNIPDGTGVLWAAKYMQISQKSKSKLVKITKWFLSIISIAIYPKYIHNVLKERVTGVDLMEKICEAGAKKGLKIFLLGASIETGKKAKEVLEKKYKSIKIVETFSGSPKEKDENEIIKKINQHSPAILFVAYGAPAQELWIKRNIKHMPSVKLAMGVGGAFDLIAGGKKRAPKWARKIGIEWLFRLVQEPKRVRRIFNATIKFPIRILLESFK
jgi:N-acetylglucosaminyldiphosphoundecaprenol N-acetyl-beta-D-mannosaminyltransferase